MWDDETTRELDVRDYRALQAERRQIGRLLENEKVNPKMDPKTRQILSVVAYFMASKGVK